MARAPKSGAKSKSAAKSAPRSKSKTAAKNKKQPDVSGEQLLTYYRDMLMIRRFEEKAGQL